MNNSTKVIGPVEFSGGTGNEQSYTKTQSAQEVIARAADGTIVGVALLPEPEEITKEVLVGAGETPPNVMDEVDGGVVTNVTETGSNSDFRKYSVTIKLYGVAGS